MAPPGEVPIDQTLVHSLLRDQFPGYADLSITRVESAGTDNAMFRLGPDLVVRLPRFARVEAHVHKEQQWLPFLAPQLPLPIPVPIAHGTPGPEFALPWSIYEWLPGANAWDAPLATGQHAAAQLGDFGAALRQIDPSDGPRPLRGDPLVNQEADVLAAIDDLSAAGVVDRPAALAAWRSIVELPQWDQQPVWTHSDLLPTNLLVHDGELSAVIDFGCMGVGDPACDLMIGYTLFGRADRTIFRTHSHVDDATWHRGRGWGFGFGLMAYHYHQLTNPVLAAVGLRSLRESLAEFVAE